MKVTLTYLNSMQVSPDSWDCFTKVIHVKQIDTIESIYEKHFKDKWSGDVDVELHIQLSDD